MANNSDILINATNVSKKFSSKLSSSLYYGLVDLTSEIFLPFAKPQSELNQNYFQNKLRKNEFWAVKDISLKVQRGECYGLIGKNGAGKTTLLRMLNGLIKPDTGRIEIKGKVGALIALGSGFNPVLTGRENIFVNSSILGMSEKQTKQLFDEIVDFAEISEAIDSPVSTYSSGMQARLGYACAAFLNTDIVFIDEVLAVGDLSFQRKCINSLLRKKENGAAIIFVSHNMQSVESVADKVLLMNRGKAYHEGIPNETINKYHNLNKSNINNIKASNEEGTLLIKSIKTLQIKPNLLEVDILIDNKSGKIIDYQCGYSLWDQKQTTRITTDTSGWHDIFYKLGLGSNSIKFWIDIGLLKSNFYYLKGGLYCPRTTMPIIRFGFENSEAAKLFLDTSELHKGKRLSFLSEQDDIMLLKTSWA